jgi:flagellar biosynthesis/type III secretory pathway M-ring protein FliF/YscJ
LDPNVYPIKEGDEKKSGSEFIYVLIIGIILVIILIIISYFLVRKRYIKKFENKGIKKAQKKEVIQKKVKENDNDSNENILDLEHEVEQANEENKKKLERY